MVSLGRTPTALATALLLALAPAGGRCEDTAAGKTIGALGTLQARDGRVELSGPGGTSVAEILVRVDQRVEAGQELIRFANRTDLEAELETLILEREELSANHERDAEVQRQEIERSRSDLGRAERDLASYTALSKNAQAATVLEERRGKVIQARHAVRIGEAELSRLVTRFRHAREKLDARLRQAERNVAASRLAAPSGGTVLRLLRRVGEPAGGPIVVLADLGHMRVECEVYEGDLGRIALGQKAEIGGKSLPAKITGKVALIGREVDAQRKVAKVWVDLDAAETAARFLGMEVNVTIFP